MNKKILYLLVVFCLTFFIGYERSFARQNITDWYIKSFDSVIKVNQNSTLDITENIIADCGNLPNKHGIFRTLPTSVNIDGKKNENPVQLISITNENNVPLKYQESKSGDTITWKIGDPKITVQGVNSYKIHYIVKNVIRFDNANFDEFYWNLNGNYWQLETEKFKADIIFPDQITNKNATVDYYTGQIGSKTQDLANFSWKNQNMLEFSSTKLFKSGDGITASVTFPKNIITPYKFSFWELYGHYFPLLIPFIVFLICFLLWKKYGDDPSVEKSIIAEYEVPDNLSPMEMGALMKSGRFNNSFITAEIIFLATKGLIRIEEIQETILFISSKDYKFIKVNDEAKEAELTKAQKEIMKSLFANGASTRLRDLKNRFGKYAKKIKDLTKDTLKEKELIQTIGINIGTGMISIGGLLLWLTFVAFSINIILMISFLMSAIILFLFSFIMPKQTIKGAELNWKVKGFKLFMETVDKDRAQFYEKENIFEKFLPYAIAFGITKLWIKKMQEIYGEEFYAINSPGWYVSSNSIASFDVDSFSSALDHLSSSISSNASSSSGAGGSGFSGGGGGGGGGGGW